MKHVVSLVRDQQAHFAYVDESTGQIVPFADLLIDPERFGLIEAAGLGTSLIDFLGLNGHQRPVVGDMTVGSGIEARRRAAIAAAAEAEEQEMIALPPEPPRHETHDQRKKRLAREAYYRKRDRKLAAQAAGTPFEKRGPGRPRHPDSTNPDLSAKEYIPKQWVVEVINQYPEGITATQIGERIWRDKLGHGDEPYERWVTRAVENRVTGMREAAKHGTPLPFRASERPKLPGEKGAGLRRLLHPVFNDTEPTTSPFNGGGTLPLDGSQ
jgi:hypothetical protein